MNILVIQNGTGSRLWRLDPYLRYAEKMGHQTWMYPTDQSIEPVAFAWADVIIAEMILERRIIDNAHALGAVVIYEVDDLIEKVTKNHPSYIQLTRATTIWRTYNCIRKSDALFCSTKNIKKRYGWINRNPQIWPNLLDLKYWAKPHRPNTTDTIRLGWAGSFAHYDDLKFIQPVIKRILDKYPKVKFVYVGMGGWHGGNPYAKFNYGEDIFADILPERREYHHGVAPDLWADKLNSLRLDIGIAPVMDNKFSRAKSNIKWQEYAINRVPGVFSECLYGDTVKHGNDGLIAKQDPEQWFNYISALIENEELRKKMGGIAYERAKTEFNIEQNYKSWLASVMKIWGDLQWKYGPIKKQTIQEYQAQLQGSVIDKQ